MSIHLSRDNADRGGLPYLNDQKSQKPSEVLTMINLRQVLFLSPNKGCRDKYPVREAML
jgi:hypothetical protein